MSERDLHSNVDDRVAINLQAISTNTTVSGAIIDTADHESLEFVFLAGTITDGAYALNIQEGDDSGLSDVASAVADDLLGAETGFVAANDNTTIRIGYIGKKRYVRAQLISTGVTTGVNMIGAVAVLGHPKSAPVAQ